MQFLAMVSWGGFGVELFGKVCVQPAWITSHTVNVPGPRLVKL
jgi:hypothetical protein